MVGCSPAFVGPTSPCTLAADPALLPAVIHETSGVVLSARHSGVFWTHNDSGGDPVLFAVDAQGELLATVRVDGARNEDWEDLAIGPCSEGSCLYIGDVGDNSELREDPAIYRVPEPDLEDGITSQASRFPVRFPDGPRDVEALYLLPDERIFLVSKGRNHPVEIYRAPAPLFDPGDPVALERIQQLSRISPALPRHVTGGSATPDGQLVVLRTYETLQIYRVDESDRLQPIRGGRVNLRPLREPQGEAIAFLDGQRLVLTSEAGPGHERGMIALLDCARAPVQW